MLFLINLSELATSAVSHGFGTHSGVLKVPVAEQVALAYSRPFLNQNPGRHDGAAYTLPVLPAYELAAAMLESATWVLAQVTPVQTPRIEVQ